MTVQDLKNNRSRIIKKLKYQGVDVSYCMNEMVSFLNNDFYKECKPLMKNIDKLIKDSVAWDFKHEYVSTDTRSMGEINREVSS